MTSLSIMTICRISQWSAPCWTWPAWAWRGSTPLCTRSSLAQCAPSHKQGQVTSKTLFFCITGRFLFCRRVVAVAWFLSFFLALPRNWIQVSHSAFKINMKHSPGDSETRTFSTKFPLFWPSQDCFCFSWKVWFTIINLWSLMTQ